MCTRLVHLYSADVSTRQHEETHVQSKSLVVRFFFLPVNKYLYCYKCLGVCKAQPEPKREKDHTYSVCLNVIFF